MKYYHLFIILIVTIILNSCSYINNFLPKKKDLTSKANPIQNEAKPLQMDICPKTRIPYKTSFIQIANLEAKIKKVSSKCEFYKNKDTMHNKKILIINFSVYISGTSQKEIDVNNFNELKLFISIINEKKKILTKLLAPVAKKDMKMTKETNIEFIVQRDFKFIYNEKNNEKLSVFYGFQK